MFDNLKNKFHLLVHKILQVIVPEKLLLEDNNNQDHIFFPSFRQMVLELSNQKYINNPVCITLNLLWFRQFPSHLNIFQQVMQLNQLEFLYYLMDYMSQLDMESVILCQLSSNILADIFHLFRFLMYKYL